MEMVFESDGEAMPHRSLVSCGTCTCGWPDEVALSLPGVVQLLNKEQDRLTKELHGIGAALAAFGESYGKQTGN
jgi:hypothetical protein